MLKCRAKALMYKEWVVSAGNETSEEEPYYEGPCMLGYLSQKV